MNLCRAETQSNTHAVKLTVAAAFFYLIEQKYLLLMLLQMFPDCTPNLNHFLCLSLILVIFVRGYL